MLYELCSVSYQADVAQSSLLLRRVKTESGATVGVSMDSPGISCRWRRILREAERTMSEMPVRKATIMSRRMIPKSTGGRSPLRNS